MFFAAPSCTVAVVCSVAAAINNSVRVGVAAWSRVREGISNLPEASRKRVQSASEARKDVPPHSSCEQQRVQNLKDNRLRLPR
jgi:hypothetical protein